MMVRWSGEHQVNHNLSLTLLDVKLVINVEDLLDAVVGGLGLADQGPQHRGLVPNTSYQSKSNKEFQGIPEHPSHILHFICQPTLVQNP